MNEQEFQEYLNDTELCSLLDSFYKSIDTNFTKLERGGPFRTFTTVVSNVKERGYKPMFYNFLCMDEIRNDHKLVHILQRLWKQKFGPDSLLDIPSLMLEAKENPDRFIETTVYKGKSMQRTIIDLGYDPVKLNKDG